MVTLHDFDADAVANLAQRTDSLGVLSLYVNADPQHIQGTAIDLKNRFRELQQRLAEDRPDDSRELSDALDRVWPRLEELAKPTQPGRGRMAFIALDSDWSLELEGQMPVANRLVLDGSPFIHPLLELLDEGRPAGVVLVSADEARLLEWRLGELTDLDQMQERYIEAPHERAGQIGGGPSGRYDSPVREQRQARDREGSERFLDEVVGKAVALATERGWEQILVSGGERWTKPAASRFPEAFGDRLITDQRVLLGLDDGGLGAAVTDVLHERHVEREQRLVEQVLDAGRSGAGALGLGDVIAALNAGRAAHLVYDPEVRYTGAVAEDGTLYADESDAPEGVSLAPEPRLTERLVEQALRTDARINPVEGAAGAALQEASGIAALLRW